MRPGGYTTIIVVICFMFTVLFFLLGIIGEYLSVILGEIRRRPIYLVRDTVNLEKEQEKDKGYYCVHTMSDVPEYKEILDQWFAAEKELAAYEIGV